MSEKTLEERFEQLLNAIKDNRTDLVVFYAADLFKNSIDQTPITENVNAFEKFAGCEIIYSGVRVMGLSVGYIFYLGNKYYFS